MVLDSIDDQSSGSKSARMSKSGRISSISKGFDRMIDDFAAKKEARELFIPGLDDYVPDQT